MKNETLHRLNLVFLVLQVAVLLALMLLVGEKMMASLPERPPETVVGWLG